MERHKKHIKFNKSDIIKTLVVTVVILIFLFLLYNLFKYSMLKNQKEEELYEKENAYSLTQEYIEGLREDVTYLEEDNTSFWRSAAEDNGYVDPGVNVYEKY